MNKRYLPVIAALLIAVTCTAFLPVFAQMPTYIYAAPTLSVVTIPQDDQLRATGVILFSDSMTDYEAGVPATATAPAQPNMIGTGTPDLMAQFKVLVSYNGLPVAPSALYCQVIEKDKYNAIKDKQFTSENLETVPVDMTSSFVCKFRWSSPSMPGVGVLDLYYVGAGLPVNIADYVLWVGATFTVGRNTVWGSDIQDVCALGWPVADTLVWVITKPDGTAHNIYADALSGYKSCEDLALQEKAMLGVPIPWN